MMSPTDYGRRWRGSTLNGLRSGSYAEAGQQERGGGGVVLAGTGARVAVRVEDQPGQSVHPSGEARSHTLTVRTGNLRRHRCGIAEDHKGREKIVWRPGWLTPKQKSLGPAQLRNARRLPNVRRGSRSSNWPFSKAPTTR